MLHLYIRGDEWIQQNEGMSSVPSALTGTVALPVISTGSSNHPRPDVAISVNRLLRSTLQRYTRTDSDYTGPIPKGHGMTVKFNVTDMVLDWIAHPNTQQELVIKTLEPWMRSLLMLDNTSENVSFVKKKKKKRESFVYASGAA